MKNASRELIEKLDLRPHPEGGYYRETYRSTETITKADGASRNLSTAIYYLLENENKSFLHRIKSDELWFFHQGEPLEIVFIRNNNFQSIILGNDVHKGQLLQAIIPSNTWFGARVLGGVGYSLVSCVVSPGFDFSEFELAKRDELIKDYPHLKKQIEAFTKDHHEIDI